MAKPPQQDKDDYMRQYLAEADLSALDLHDIDLQADAAAERAWQWVHLGFAGAQVAALLWVMNTDFYLFHGHGTALIPMVWLILVATLAWMGLQIFGLSHSMQTPHLQSLSRHMPRPGASFAVRGLRLDVPAAWQRYLWLATGLSLGGMVLFYLPQEAQWQGTGYSGQWFVAVGAALLAGISLGRWLIAQAAHAQSRAQHLAPAPPFVWPTWFKWVTLASLVAAGLFAAFGAALLGNNESATTSFELSGLGLVVGISAAIWIARRFDEWEADFKKQAAQKNDELPGGRGN